MGQILARINVSYFCRHLWCSFQIALIYLSITLASGSWGKCSHGGKYDSTWTQVATGGINKDSSDPAISPHYHLHHDAAMLAIRGGEALFNDEGNTVICSDFKFSRQCI